MIVQRLIIEIRERKVLQTVIIYLGGFWGLLQALDFLFQKLHVESNLVSILLVVGLCIFPSILVFSWYRSSQGAFKKQLFFYASNGIVVALSLVYYPSQLDGNNSIEEEPNESAIAVLPFTDLVALHRRQ